MTKSHKNLSKNNEKTRENMEESFNLEEIMSTNPFQRISRSIIKELHIKTRVNSFLKFKKEKIVNKSKVLLKIQRKKNEKIMKNTEIIENNDKNNVIIEEIPEKNIEKLEKTLIFSTKNLEKTLIFSTKKADFEHKIEEILMILSSKQHYRKKLLNLETLSKLLDSYKDLGFSAEELFKSNIAKIFKTINLLLKNPRFSKGEFSFVSTQLESILLDIKEKVVFEVFSPFFFVNYKFFSKS